jgi:hypothetical protein
MNTSLTRSAFGALVLAALGVASLGCAGVDESGELVGEVAQADITTGPVLVASPSTVAFGMIPRGRMSILSVELTNTGAASASSITVGYPPDPYRLMHNPPGYLAAGASSTLMQVAFTPSLVGTFSRTFTVNYRAPDETLQTLTIPLTGTAY